MHWKGKNTAGRVWHSKPSLKGLIKKEERERNEGIKAKEGKMCKEKKRKCQKMKKREGTRVRYSKGTTKWHKITIDKGIKGIWDQRPRETFERLENESFFSL